MTGSVDGLRVRETMTFRSDSYVIDKRFRVENTGPTARTVTIALPWSTRQDWKDEKPKEKFQGQHPTEIVWAADGSVHHAEDLCNIHTVTADGPWIGMGSIWYMSAMIPHAGGFKLAHTR